MKSYKSILTIVAVLSSTTFLQSSPVFAGKQIYPGSMCVSWNGSFPVPRLNSSRIYNDSTSAEMRVDCPILHQNFNPVSGNNLDDSDIGVIENNQSRRARCWSVSRHQVGAVLRGGTGGTRFTSLPGASTREQNIDFATTTARHPDNWYYIGCTIPRKQAGRGPSGITYFSGQD